MVIHQTAAERFGDLLDTSRPSRRRIQMSMWKGVAATALSAIAGLTAALGEAAEAFAQAAPVSASAQSDALAEIVVTAQKRQQSIETVGMAVNAVSGEQLRDLGVNNVADLAKIEPSFAVGMTEYSVPYYQIRGIGFNTDTLGAPPAVTVYVDEIPLPFSIMTKGAALDLERVEILKGPQGTLFGQNATGGAVNYIAAKPTDTFQTGVDVTYGRFNSTTVEGFLSGPLVTDKLKVRLAFDVDEGGAWQRSVTRGDSLGNKDNKRARLLLDWTPTEKLKISVNVNGWSDNSDRQAPADYALALGNPAGAPFVPLTVNEPIAPRDPAAADWTQSVPPRNDEHFYQGAVRLDYKASDATTITFIAADEYFNADDQAGIGGTATPWYLLQSASIHSTFGELRASGKTLNDRLDWVIGANYSKDNDDEAATTYAAGSSEAHVPFGVISLVDATMTQYVTTKAGFGNLEYRIVDDLSVHGGVRYTISQDSHSGCTRAGDAGTASTFTTLETLLRGGVGVIPITPGGCADFNSAFLPTLSRDSLNEHNLPWRFGVDWNPFQKTLLYADVTRGYKAGSFVNVGAAEAESLAPAKQEELTAYEGGVKSRPAGGRLKIEGAVFYYDYRNKQQELAVPDPVFNLLAKLLNVPKSSEEGAELAATYRPLNGLTLTGSMTYLQSKVIGDFFSYSQFGTRINFKGEQLPITPKWAGDIGARYDWKLGGNYDAYFGGDVRLQGMTQSYFGAYAATAAGYPSMVNASYALLNLRAGLESSDGQWRMELFGENVTDTYYTVQSTHIDTVARYVGMPATYGIRVSYRYF